MSISSGPVITFATLLLAVAGTAAAAEARVNITPQLAGIDAKNAGRPLRIERNQDRTNTITPDFQRTSRKCPPFCIQPMRMPEGVETIGEIEMLDYLRRQAEGDDSILIVDSRGPSWLNKGTIPGSVNVHYKRLSRRASEESEIAEILQKQFGAERGETLWNFRDAKTLVLFCNGAWCGQSPTNIRGLLRLGYPASKLKWYRGGMQSWETLGLTTVVPE
jgi:rhodanese-related sulfurtransferase